VSGAPEAPGRPRGFAVTAGLDPEVAGPLAARCEALGYGSLWSNDHRAADGLETLAALARGSSRAALGIAGLALDRRDPASIAASVGRAGLDPDRLLLAVGAGATSGGVALLHASLPELRSALPGATLLASGTQPGIFELAGELFDGALVEWMTPELIAEARARVEAGAARAGRPTPPLLGYVRAAVGADAETRLARDEGFYRAAPTWQQHFARLLDPGRTGIFCDLPAQVPAALEPYEAALDTLIVRGLAATRLPNLERIATAAGPGPRRVDALVSPGPEGPRAASTAR
jgi:alkanesulfonate monooxygenase SsuD/methylene tetrahydromethanopterin reductase-like flavin-dependent oxidoreductase (luciferase family)